MAVDGFAIKPDDKILDVGCGPALWTRMFTEKSDKVLGIDCDAGAIAKARKSVSNADFKTIGFDDISGHLGQFDKVFFINALPYCADPIGIVERVRKHNLRPSGQVIIRNWDQASFMVHPMPEELAAKMKYLLCVARNGSAGFDDNFGRKIPSILKGAGFKDVATCSQVIERTECDSDIGQYIAANGQWTLGQIKDLLLKEEIDLLERIFDINSSYFIGRSQAFYMSIVEHTFIGHA